MSTAMAPEEVAAALLGRFPEIRAKQVWGETSFFYNPRGQLAHGTYFTTLKTADGPNDQASALHRLGVYRLNFGLPKATFLALFGPPPRRPGKGGCVEGPWDFTELDQLTPHPVYGWCGWVAVLSPSTATFGRLLPLVDEAHEKARRTFQHRKK